MPLTMPFAMTHAIASVARAGGAELVETGGFILGQADTSTGSVLALTGKADIGRDEHLFHVGGLALTTLFDWADDHELSVLAQWHTHRRGAFLSETDLLHGLNVPGFHTSVVPDYEQPSPDPSKWGWWTYQSGAWVPAATPKLTAVSFQTITFEQRAVHEH
jgi:hypothetical protein